MPKTIEVHVAWNDTAGELDRLTHVEFIDCEFMALETDVLNGEWIAVGGNKFAIYADEKSRHEGNQSVAFSYRDLHEHVGNIMWDMLSMLPDDAAKFAHWLQSQKHWTLTCSANGIRKRYGKYTVQEFRHLFEKEMGE